MNSTYAQNLRLRKIQNRRFAGQDKFSVGKRGEPIPGELDPVTLARRQRRALKRPINLKRTIKNLESAIMWHHKKCSEIEKTLEEKKNDKKLLSQHAEFQLEIKRLQQQLILKQQSLSTVLS